MGNQVMAGLAVVDPSSFASSSSGGVIGRFTSGEKGSQRYQQEQPQTGAHTDGYVGVNVLRQLSHNHRAGGGYPGCSVPAPPEIRPSLRGRPQS